jgi:biotin carboxylase
VTVPTLLMVESWVNSTGLCLPPRLADRGHDYVLVTRDPATYGPTATGSPHPVVRDAAEVVVAETNDLPSVVEATRGVAARRRIDGVLTTCDYYLEATATVAERLGLPGPSPAAMHTASRKHLVRHALAGAGVPNPAYAVVAGWDEAQAAAAGLGYPLVAKPVDLNSGTSVRLVHDEAGLKDAVLDIRAIRTNTRGQPLHRLVLLEQAMVGTEVSVEAVTHEGRTTVLGITDKTVTGPPAFVEVVHMVPAALPPGDEVAVESLVVDTLAAVGFTHGVSHTEVMLTADGPRVVELNPRQGGGYIFDLVELVTGTHPLDVVVDLALGLSPDVGTVAAPRPGAVPTVPSAAVGFVISPEPGTVARVDGVGRLDGDPGIVRWELPTPAVAPRPVDNEAYLGHVLAVDPHARGARRLVEAALASLRLVMADGRRLVPLGALDPLDAEA